MAPRSTARASVRSSGRTSQPEPEQGREVDLRKELLNEARSYLDNADTSNHDGEPLDAMKSMMRAAQCLEVVKFLDTGKWDVGDDDVFGKVGMAELEQLLDDLDAESED